MVFVVGIIYMYITHFHSWFGQDMADRLMKVSFEYNFVVAAITSHDFHFSNKSL